MKLLASAAFVLPVLLAGVNGVVSVAQVKTDAHEFEIYPGTHTSKVAVRFQEHVMPFFSQALSSEQGGRR